MTMSIGLARRCDGFNWLAEPRMTVTSVLTLRSDCLDGHFTMKVASTLRSGLLIR